MKLPKFKSIRTNLTFWFLLLAITPLLSGIIISYFQQKNAIEKETFNKLIAIRDLKVAQLEKWLDERIGDLKVTSGDYEIRALENIFDKEPKSADDIKKIETAHALLNRYLENFNTYEEIFIIDAKTGFVEISTDKSFEGKNLSQEPSFTIPLESGGTYIKDIYYSKTLNKPQMTISHPIYCLTHSKHIIGILVVRFDLDNSLFKLLSERVGLGETGETLIVNKDVIALNNLRGYENAVLKLKIDAKPAVEASNGKTGITITKDYRGVDVLAAYTYIPETGWGFVCKQDISELNAPILAMMWNLILLLVVAGLIVILIVAWISKSISKPIVNLKNVAQKIALGDLSARSTDVSEGEIGELSLGFNKTADMLESKIKVQQGIAEISNSMLGKTTLQDFANSLLKHLMKLSNANMSTFYILNEVSMEYEHFTSVGANKEMINSFSAENPQGEFGNVLSTKKIFHLKDIPENTIFKFKTVAGEAIPKEIITIPVLVEEVIVAIISLVNINKFSTDYLETLNQSWINLNTSYSNLIATERTNVLAEHLSMINQELEAQSEELQDQAEELQDQASELQRTSDELQEQNIELEAQRKEVETANKLKSEFLSNMSHELRTPLNSIMALSRVLIIQAKEKLNDEENNYLEIVERNGKRLLSLINDILDLSKIEAGKMEVNPSFISLESFLNIIKENIQSLSEEKGLSLNLNIENDLPQIETDEMRLHQVLTNILGNAVKFTDKGSIDISVQSNTEFVLIKVKDSGIGISEDDLPYIFDEFRQADGTSARQYEGTGLGLAIARKLMNILGGDIEIESELGKGTTFSIRIPIKWQGEIREINKATIKTSSKENEKTILVVDDDAKTVGIITDFLNDEGYQTIYATSGKEALEMAERYQPFAITLDIIMEGMDGWEVLQKLKSNFKTKDIPVIVVSVSDDRDTGLALGAVGFIIKPVNKHVLISQIREINKLPTSVMIVDDNQFELKQISTILEKEHINTIKATGGKECLQLLKTKIPDVLILDLMMPDMDGFMVLDEIRKNKETQNLPVIIATAKDLTKEDKNKLSGNVSSLITKSESSSRNLLLEIKRIIKELEKSRASKQENKKETQKRILIVEDNIEAIIQIKSVLEREHYKVDIASGGQEALDYIKQTIPDGIILDLMMPEIDGFEVLKKIRAMDITKNIPILILTAKDLTREDLAQLSNNNVQQLVQKGDIDIKGLLLKVKTMLEEESKMRDSRLFTSDKSLKSENLNLSPNVDLQKVLVVEDNVDNMTTIKAILKDNYAVSEAYDGEQGLSLANLLLPDIMLLDISLPKLSGDKILKQIKTNKHTKNIPVIAVTAQAMKGDKEKFLKLGFDGYVPKPISQEILLEEISKLLDGK